MAESDADDFESADEGEEYAEKEKLKEATEGKTVSREKQESSPSTNDKVESVTNKLQELNTEEEKTKSIPPETSNESDLEVKDTTNLNPSTEDKDLTSVLDKLSSNNSTPPEKSSWGWGSWGASLVSTATASVSTFTNQLGEGFTTVLESVEDVLGAPPPEQLAAQQKDNEKEIPGDTENNDKSEQKTEQSLFSGLASLTGVLEKTGTKVLSTGLDTLELLGKKTMDVLQEGDPGLKNKRSLFREPNTSLSEVLREAKNKADIKTSNEILESKKANYSILFDNYQGLIHLEALEMLSKENEDRLPSILAKISSDSKSALKEQFQTISEMCILSDYEEDEERKDNNFDEILTEEIPLLHPDLKVSRLREVYNKSQSYLKNYQEIDEKFPVSKEEIHSNAIEILAEFTASIMEFLHKLAELILLQNSDGTDISAKLSSVVKAFCLEINETATKFSEFLNRPSQNSTSDDQDILNALTTEIFLEASNSGTYVEDALLLMIPILQVVRAEPYLTEN